MNHKPFGGRIAALFLALAAAVLMASPVFANWCTHVYGSRHAYETQYDADGEVTGQHLTRTTCAFCGAVNVHLPEDDPNYGKDVALPEDCEYEDTVIEPTCTEGGYTVHTCTKCGGSYRDSFTEPLGHALCRKRSRAGSRSSSAARYAGPERDQCICSARSLILQE